MEVDDVLVNHLQAHWTHDLDSRDREGAAAGTRPLPTALFLGAIGLLAGIEYAQKIGDEKDENEKLKLAMNESQ